LRGSLQISPPNTLFSSICFTALPRLVPWIQAVLLPQPPN
jgi:hypothetical protein